MANTSSKAKDRSLSESYSAIKHRTVRLPRFQCYEAWNRKHSESFMKNIM